MSKLTHHAGCDVHLSDYEGKQAIHYAAMAPECYSWLIEHGAPNPNGRHPTLVWGGSGSRQALSLLTKYGADIHSECSFGAQPVHYALVTLQGIP